MFFDAFFSAIANVRFVYSKPVYGLIFLFHWREDNPVNQEASCPDGLWFANQVCSFTLLRLSVSSKSSQTTSNACASVALLNIVNNIEGIHLGEHLANFKDFTMPFTPALRGDAVANFEFVKRIHNSFARYVYGFVFILFMLTLFQFYGYVQLGPPTQR